MRPHATNVSSSSRYHQMLVSDVRRGDDRTPEEYTGNSIRRERFVANGQRNCSPEVPALQPSDVMTNTLIKQSLLRNNIHHFSSHIFSSAFYLVS